MGCAHEMNSEIRILMLEEYSDDAELAECELRDAKIAFVAKRVAGKTAFMDELKDFAPDVIFADFALTGFTALDALRLLHEYDCDIPFILVTGSLSELVAVECMKQGADDYVLKSSLKRLPSALLNVLKKKELERAKAEAEELLRQAEDEHRVILDYARDLISLLDVDGKFIYASPSFKEVLGFTPRELLGISALSLLHPDDREAMMEVLKSPASGQDGRLRVWRFKRHDGGWRTFESSWNWVLNEEGNRKKAVVVSRGVTEGSRGR